MHTQSLFLLALMTPLLCAAAEEVSSESPDTGSQVVFACTVLEPKSAYPSVSTSGDTVRFELYYVDTECGEYVYEFEKQDTSLIVRRVTADPAHCDDESDGLYAVEGTIAHAPKGRYLFELESLIGDRKSTIFREVVDVK